VSRRAGFVALGAIVAVAALYGVSFVWPAYNWDLKVPSPDGRYDLVVLRGNATAFADFSYHIYLFPHASTPVDRAKASRVWFTPIWRGTKYLVYSGFDYPMFRWTGPNSIEIDLTDTEPMPFRVEHVKRFKGSREAVVTSVVFGREDSENALP
jgi:hypothetical protein